MYLYSGKGRGHPALKKGIPMGLNLTIDADSGSRPLEFPVQRLVCAGWVGRDAAELRAHVEELEKIGIPGPRRTPIHMNLSANLVTTADTVEVISGETSGEVEYVYLRTGESAYLGVGSDHTDRGFEQHSIPASKQMYPKVMAPTVWPYQEVREHWDRLVLRSWMTVGGEKSLYQEDALSAILDVDGILDALPPDDPLPRDGLVLFSGTVATRMGMVYGDRFDFELEDPVLGRRLSHGYRVLVRPQHL